MSQVLIEVGEKVHVITRRRFPEDLRRHFAGVVRAVSENYIRAEGYVFVYGIETNKYQRSGARRVRVLALTEGNIINVLPPEVDVNALQYAIIDGRLNVTDGEYTLEINEFGAAT